MKASSSHKGPYEFDQLLFVQDFKSEHIGPVWCMKFSACGRSVHRIVLTYLPLIR